MSKKQKSKKIRLAIINKVLFIIVIALGVYYVAGINDLAIKGFELQELKGEIADTRQENSKLELKIMDLSSYNNLDNKIKELSMVESGSIGYIALKGNVVAKK